MKISMSSFPSRALGRSAQGSYTRRCATALPTQHRGRPTLGRRQLPQHIPHAAHFVDAIQNGHLTDVRLHGELREAAQDALSGWLSQSGADTASGQHTHLSIESLDLAWSHDQRAAGSLLMAGATVKDSNGSPAAVVALAACVDDLNNSQLRAHWACTKGRGKGWKAPPPGWHTSPSDSHDAGGGAWQSAFGPSPQRKGVVTLVLQVPLTGPLSGTGSGLAMALTTTDGRWIKQVDTKGNMADIFYETSGLSAAPKATSPPPARRRADTPSASRTVPAPPPPRPASPPPQRAPSPPPAPARAPSPPPRRATPQAARPTPQPARPTPQPARPTPQPQRSAAESRDTSKSDGKAKDTTKPGVPVTPKKPAVEVPVQVKQLGLRDGEELERLIVKFRYNKRSPQDVSVGGSIWQNGNVCGWMVDSIGNREGNAQRSLMHRFNEATELADHAAGCGDWNERQTAVTALSVWLRMSAMRLLVWNRNYNVKPREISAAQDRLVVRLCEFWAASGPRGPELRPLMRMALAAVGRGGQGDVGQRVRDEILVVQQKNNCKGGMMEEWHQKLHNNTSPDDVVICEALLEYCRSDLDISAYWRVLHANNINAERLRSFDRKINSEPNFRPEQVPGLIRDLTSYLHTLRAVHCGTDLASAAGNVLGYSAKGMVGNKDVNIPPVPGLATDELRTLLGAALHLQHVLQSPKGANAPGALFGVVRLLELLAEARHIIRPTVLAGDSACGGRHRDVVFLDIALESAARTALETSVGALRAAAAAVSARGPSASDRDFKERNVSDDDERRAIAMLCDGLEDGKFTLLEALAGGSADDISPTQNLTLLLEATTLATENATLSSFPNEELVSGMKWLNALHGMKAGEQQRDRALMAISAVDRLKRTLDEQASAFGALLQPTAHALGHKLGVHGHGVDIFSEEAVRGTAAAPLSQLLGVIEPCLRRMVGSGEWQIVSRGEAEHGEGVSGHVVTQHRLEDVHYNTYDTPTVLVVDNLAGHEEVPEGCVAVISANGQCPDMLSHSAVRARNMNVLLAACYNDQTANWLRSINGQHVRVKLNGQSVHINT